MKTTMLTVFLVLSSALSFAAQAPAPAPAKDAPDYEALDRSVVLDLATAQAGVK